jgi:hypothetical protein
MDDIGGWEVTIQDGERVIMCTVANKDERVARRLALSHVGGGKVILGDQLWESEIAALHLRPNDVKSATVVKPVRNG